jgi:hypothetical protein
MQEAVITSIRRETNIFKELKGYMHSRACIRADVEQIVTKVSESIIFKFPPPKPIDLKLMSTNNPRFQEQPKSNFKMQLKCCTYLFH